MTNRLAVGAAPSGIAIGGLLAVAAIAIVGLPSLRLGSWRVTLQPIKANGLSKVRLKTSDCQELPPYEPSEWADTPMMM